MRLALLALPFLVGACATAPRLAAPAPTAGSVAAVVAAVTTQPPLERTHWGVAVYDPASRRLLYSLNPEQHFIPASNTKLVVTAVALGVLGPEYRYRTELYAVDSALKAAEGRGRGERAATGTAVEGLVLVARGDPTLSRRFHPEGPTPLESLADSVAAAGIRRVSGEVVIDASYFEYQPVHPAWEVGDLVWGYGAPTDAFAVEEATFRVVVEPGAVAGEPALVTTLAPPGAVAVRAAVITDTAGSARRTTARRLYLSDLIEITGTVPLGARPDTIHLAAPHPAELAAREFVAMLAARGVRVEGGVRVVRDTLEAAALRGEGVPGGAAGSGALRPIATWRSAPLAEIVAAILKPSQNWIAEQLLKTLGAERGARGNWREGLGVEREYLHDVVGIDSTAVWLSDGSGLSAQNLLTPQAIIQLLDHARGQPWGTVYLQAMAQPGESGTLERRLTEFKGRLFAKTGSVTHVNTLSGYLYADDGRELLFSIMTNATGWPAAEVRRAMDRVVRAVAARR
jgi:D-alanyl-D-alanine carboxypeptidase/D-alanyl-D-alanine-endopeptidase (penicillin-binding protein 4)